MAKTVSSLKPTQPSTSSYSLPSGFLTKSDEIRFDAGRYSPSFIDAVHALRESGMRLERLADVTKNVFIPPRFKRIYVEREHGVPFLQGSHVVQFQPADLKYLSLSSPRLERWIVRAGWLLVTCSGTIGRTTVCPDEWDEWAASQHILRIVPDEEKCPAGYLCAFLSSPFGQAQLTANIYGAVVDELTEEQAEGILVPVPRTSMDRALVRSADAVMREAVSKRSEAMSSVNEAVGRIPVPPASVPQPNRFSLWTRHISEELRMDAGHYNPVLLHVLDQLGEMGAVPLREIAEIFMPPRFRRIYVEPEYGLPFLQGTHAIHFLAAGLKYLSREHEYIDKVTVKAGWLFVTRSGTVGRVVMCPEEWDGWAATEDIIRVIPDEARCPGGYLFSFLASPMGQIQLTSQVHGAVVDHLTEDHVGNVLVPLPHTRTRKKIDSVLRRGIDMKSLAVAAAEASVSKLTERFAVAEPKTQQLDEDPIVHKGKDLRIPNTTPEQLAKSLLSGGAKPQPETKKRKAS